MNDQLYWIWFSEFNNVTPNSKALLLDTLGSAEKIYTCSDFSQYSFLTIQEKTCLMNKNLQKAEEIFKASETHGISIITFDSENYPDTLRHIYNPPYVLYAKGVLPDWDSGLFIGIVGTRHCTEYGLSAVDKFAKEFAQYGVYSVSGLARGIDSAVAQSSLKYQGYTIAVLGCGIDIAYPPENKKLLNELFKENLVLSEFPPGTPPLPFHFPLRNRIISGLSHGILVVESEKKGGSLITAGIALEQGKDVFAVPGSIFHKASEGANNLIKNAQAKAVSCAMDILLEYKYSFSIEPKKETNESKPITNHIETEKFSSLSDDEKKIAEALISGPLYADEISHLTGIPAASLTPTLSLMEFDGYIEKESGNIYKLKI